MKRKRDLLPFTKEQVYAEYEAALMRLALLELQEEELEELEEPAGERDQQDGARDARLLAGLWKAGAIGSIRRRDKRGARVSAFKALPGFARTLVSVMLVVAIGFAIAFAALPPFRARVLEFVLQTAKEHSGIDLREGPGALMDVYGGWQGMR